MAQTTTLIFPDSDNNNFTVMGNILFNNYASADPLNSPGGSSGVSITQLKGYNQTFSHNIVADSLFNSGVFVGVSAGGVLGRWSVTSK